MHHQCGHSRRAVELIGRAVALRPGQPSSTPIWPRPIARSASTNNRSWFATRPWVFSQIPRGSEQFRPGLAVARPARRGRRAVSWRAGSSSRFAMAQDTWARRCGNKGSKTKPWRPSGPRFPLISSVRRLAQPRTGPGRSRRRRRGARHCQEAVWLWPDFAAGQHPRQRTPRLNHWAEAHAAYAESVRLAPDIPEVHVNRGRAFRGDGQFAKAAIGFAAPSTLLPMI